MKQALQGLILKIKEKEDQCEHAYCIQWSKEKSNEKIKMVHERPFSLLDHATGCLILKWLKDYIGWSWYLYIIFII